MSGWDTAAPASGDWDTGVAATSSEWGNGTGGDSGQWGEDTKGADASYGDSNAAGGFGEGVKLDDGVANENGGGFACYNCGAEGHASKDCTEEHKPRGECYNCGEVGHNKAECPNEKIDRPFTGTCHLCEMEGHRASECPTRPPDICKNCLKEGHKAAACEAPRAIDRTHVPDMTEAEVMALFKEASDDRDVELFKLGVQALVKGNGELTYVDIEEKLRAGDFNLYLIAIEKEVPKAMANTNLQGVTDCKYIVNYMFSAKPKRIMHATGWPENAEVNREQLKEAGEAMPHVLPLCRNCDELGHVSKSCPEAKVEREPEIKNCHICNEQHLTRNCPGERPDRSGSAANVECRRCHETGHFSKDCTAFEGQDNTCRNCGQEGHKSKECTEERNMSLMTCRNCNQVGHLAKDCTEPRDMSTMVCRNCDETGHGSRECPKPRDYSRVECQNCHKMGHTRVRCKEAEADANAGADFGGADFDANGGAGAGAGGNEDSFGGGEAGDWDTGKHAATEEASEWGANSAAVSAW